jgi:hypothetical protein
MTYTERDGAGRVVSEGSLDSGDTLDLLDAFNPLDLRLGGGLNVSAVHTDWVDLDLRVGVAARRARYHDGRYVESAKDGSLVLLRLADDDSWGGEAALQGAFKLGQAVSLTLDGSIYLPQDQFDDLRGAHPIVRAAAGIAFAINPFLSVVYEGELRREAYEIKDLQYADHLSLRVHHTLF